MTKVIVGDVRKDNKKYVVCMKERVIENVWVHVVYEDGEVSNIIKEDEAERNILLANYKTWKEAINSKEFNK